MTSDLLLRRKWTLRAHGRQVVFVKRSNERSAHVLMKAFVWALYLPQYPDLKVEIAIGDRFKPDVVSLPNDDPFAEPRFWGEAGQVAVDKIESLARRYRHTHFAIAKWDTSLRPFEEIVKRALHGLDRTAPFDLICFPADSADRFIDDHGEIHLRHDDVEWLRL
ncbi:MAG: hypothetical protein KDD84_17190 [Caldilineaceae bacterium]|nr:hypothetical protein [Caldilineaceae bacterium]